MLDPDFLCRRQSELFRGWAQPGRKPVNLAAGVYFAPMQAGSFKMVRRLVQLKRHGTSGGVVFRQAASGIGGSQSAAVQQGGGCGTLAPGAVTASPMLALRRRS